MSEGGIKSYFQQIGTKELLTREEEQELAQRIEQGDQQARKKLIESNLRLVIDSAKKYSYYGVDFEDLIQAGNEGLIKAADEFDWRKGYKFSTYAFWWIRQKIIRTMNNHSRTIRRPAHFNENLSKLYKAEKKLRQNNDKVTAEKLAEETEFKEKKIREMKIKAKQTLSLDKPFTEEGNFTKLDHLERQRKAQVEKEMESENLREILEQAFEQNPLISDREKQVIKLRFGVEDYQSRTLEEVGDIFDISRERVRQIQKRTLDKLEKYFLDHPNKKPKSVG